MEICIPRIPSTNESVEESSRIPSTNDSFPSVFNVRQQVPPPTNTPTPNGQSVDLNDLPRDPADRPNITTYHPNQRDEVRRAYLLQEPCRPKGHNFPSKLIGTKKRRFVVDWFDEFDWLEYSIKENKAYCLYCYLCGDIVGQRGGRDAFVTGGFDTCSKKKHLGFMWVMLKVCTTKHDKNVIIFTEVVEVLNFVEEDGTSASNRHQALGILTYFKTLDFMFYLHLMYEILVLTSVLSKHLQRKDQDILEVASLVKGTMDALKTLRNTGFANILEKVFTFCRKHNIDIVDMSEDYVPPRIRRTKKVTNQYHFEVEIYNTVLYLQIVEFRDRFSEITTKLLEYMAALSPRDSFACFDKLELVKLSELYKNDFNDSDKMHLHGELEIYYHSLRNDERFTSLNGIADFSRLTVETGKHRSYPLVYKLIKLALVLPVATTTVERCFSAMKLLKTDLRNKMGDDFMNDALICSVEKEALLKVKIEDVMVRFQNMSVRRGQI